jgi:DNA-binding NarL/FixJ family response regulator
MQSSRTTEPVLPTELEALVQAARERLCAELDHNEDEIRERDRAVVHAAGAAIAAGMSLSSVAQAEQTGQARARRELGGELLLRVERTARRSREATAEYEQTVARAARIGLAHRDIAAAAQIAHATIRSIITRTSDTTTVVNEPPEPPSSERLIEEHGEPQDS